MKYGLISSILMISSIVACSQPKINIKSSATPNPVTSVSLSPTISPTIIPTLTLIPLPITPSFTPIPIFGTIVFTSTSRIYSGISLLNLQNGKIQGVTGMGSESISWSPDGEQIAFNGEIPPDPSDGIIIQTINLFLIKSDGSEYKRLTQSSQGKGDVNWSPDGKFLAYRYDNHIQSSDLAIFDLDKEITYLLTATNGYEGHPTWSPDGKQIAYLYTADIEQPNELWMVDAAGNNAKRVLEFSIAASRIDWSPNGQWIAFIGAKNFQTCGDVFIVRPDGSELTQVTNLSGCAKNAIWSLDGEWLAFIEQKDDFNNFKEWQSQISIVDVSGENHAKVTIEETLRINDIDWQPKP